VGKRSPIGPTAGIAFVLVILASVLALSACGRAEPTPGNDPSRDGAGRLDDPGDTVALSRVVRVARVIDGDTIAVDEPVNGTDTVRLIGVDAPEMSHPTYGEQPYGQEAAEFTASKLQPGREIALEFDVEKTDRYGRTLAYVWLLDSGAMFNEILLREGRAQVANFPPNVKYEDRFLEAQREAREAGRGLWGLSEGELCQQTDRGNGIGGGCI